MNRKISSFFIIQSVIGSVILLVFLIVPVTGLSGDVSQDIGPLPKIKAPGPERAALGKLLFFDLRLSGDANLSCASCHHPDKGWTDGNELSAAYPGSKYFRNTQTILNMAYKRYFYWDGRLTGKDRATQVRDKITETHFMNLDGRLMQERLKQVPEYVARFKKAFGGEPSFGKTLKAIAAFEQTLISQNVPFDSAKISEEAQKGLDLFKGKAGCIQCHNGPMFSDFEPYKLGVPEHPELFTDPERATTFRSVLKFLGVPNFENLRKDPGFFIVSKLKKDFGKFLTPSLREVSRTAPYMHNGTIATLEDVVDFKNRGGGEGSELKPLNLSADEKKALVAFLNSLSGDEITVDPPKIPEYQVIANWRKMPN